MMAATLTLSLIEIILLLFGAIILGITIHFFIASRKNLRATTEEMEKSSFARDEWKLRYFNDMESKDKELSSLKEKLQEAEENSSIYSMEADEMRRHSKLLKTELDNARNNGELSEAAEKKIAALKHENNQLTIALEAKKAVASDYADHSAIISDLRRQVNDLKSELTRAGAINTDREEQDKRVQELQQQVYQLQAELEQARNMPVQESNTHEKPDYLQQLQEAQKSLVEHNQKINELLGNIEVIREKEEKEREILRDNEELYAQVDDMRNMLDEKEKEIDAIRQKEHLTSEMTSRLDSAYNEFNTLQEKIQKLESQLTASRMMNLELEDLREAHTRQGRDFEEQRHKSNRLTSENQQLQSVLAEVENKLRDANFQRQQLQKRVAYLEELNNDLQVVSDTNKKLESQLRRVGELESMLNVVSEERDRLKQRATNA